MEELPLEVIENLDKDFDIFTRPEKADVRNLELGLYPPLPLAGNRLVWGFHLVEAAGKVHIPSLMTVVLPEKPAEAAAAALRLENRIDGYSWAEKERIAELFGKLGLSAGDAGRLEPLVQRKGSFLSALSQYRVLSNTCKAMVNAGEADLRTAWTVRGLPEAAAARLRAVAAPLSFSSRRELFTMTCELLERTGKTGRKGDELLDMLEKSNDPVSAVKALRYPMLKELEKRFEDFRNRTAKGTGIDLRAPANFEGSRFSVSFTWETDRQFDRILENLHTIREQTDELYRLLYGPFRQDLSD